MNFFFLAQDLAEIDSCVRQVFELFSRCYDKVLPDNEHVQLYFWRE